MFICYKVRRVAREYNRFLMISSDAPDGTMNNAVGAWQSTVELLHIEVKEWPNLWHKNLVWLPPDLTRNARPLSSLQWAQHSYTLYYSVQYDIGMIDHTELYLRQASFGRRIWDEPCHLPDVINIKHPGIREFSAAEDHDTAIRRMTPPNACGKAVVGDAIWAALRRTVYWVLIIIRHSWQQGWLSNRLSRQ
jgi:hypothetical protein